MPLALAAACRGAGELGQVASDVAQLKRKSKNKTRGFFGGFFYKKKLELLD